MAGRAGSERVTPETAIDRYDSAADIMREGRGKEDSQHREVFGFAISAGRDFGCGMALAVLFGVVAADLLAHDSSGRDRVDGDPVFADIARQAFGPGVHRSLGGKGGVEPVGLRFAGDVDDAAPAALDHLPKESMGDLALPSEVEGDPLLPLFLRRIEG